LIACTLGSAGDERDWDDHHDDAWRDDRRASGSPSRTHCGAEVQAKKALIGLKKQRAIELADLNQAILEVSVEGIRERGAASPPHPNTLNKDRKKPKHRDISN